jgi:hypothetical protein
MKLNQVKKLVNELGYLVATNESNKSYPIKNIPDDKSNDWEFDMYERMVYNRLTGEKFELE